MKSSTAQLPPLKSVKVLDQLRERIRYLHYSIRTEEVYVYWVRVFVRFHGLRHPATMGGVEVEAFLSWLVNSRNVASSTHKQALSALLFFYGKVLGVNLPWMTEIGRPRTKRHLPVVLLPDEIARILCLLEGEHLLFAQLLYGTGRRTRSRGDARCSRPQIPSGRRIMELVLGFPAGHALRGSALRGRAPASHVRPDVSESLQARVVTYRNHQTCNASYPSPIHKRAEPAFRVRANGSFGAEARPSPVGPEQAPDLNALSPL